MAPMRNQSSAIANARRSANTFMDPNSNNNAAPSTSQLNSSSSSSKTSYPLQRGSACLSCRKRKMKCDASKPVCQQCIKGNRQQECEYDDGKSKSRTQMLQEKVSKLQDRIRELETKPSRHSSASPPSPASSTMGHTSSYPTLTQTQPSSHTYEHDMYPSHVSLPSYTSAPEPLLPPAVSTNHLEIPYSNQGMYSSASSSGSASPGPEFGSNSLASMGAPAPAPSWGLRTENDGQWWNNEDLTPQWRQTLLDLFLPHRHQASFAVHVPTFLSLLNGPASTRPHPALMNSIYLLATHFAPTPTLSQLEPKFLERALAHLSSALENSDRLVNVIQASCLLATWFFGKMRLLEGYYHASSAGRLAIGLGLHQIRSDAFPPFPGMPSDGGILPAPRSRLELGERILAFWQVFNVDRSWAVATGLPSGLSDDDHPRTRILTVWPRDIEEYVDGAFDFQPFVQHQPSLQSLYPGYSQSPSPPTTPNMSGYKDSLPAMRAKATAFFERASRLSASYEQQQSHGVPFGPGGADKFWGEFRALNRAITQFLGTLPPIPPRIPSHGIHGHASMGGMSSTAQIHHMTRATLLTVHSLAQVALIQLHHTFSLKDIAAHEKCLEAANVVLTFIPSMDESDYAYLDPIMGTCWMCVCDVLLREQSHRQQLSHAAQVPDMNYVNRELDTVVTAMKCFGTVFPLASCQVAKVEQNRQESISTY